MNPVHIHLALNHIVIAAALFAALLFIYGIFRKNETIKNIALSGFVLSAITAIPVFLTGEPSEESVENLPGVIESVIESHEDAATFALWVIEIAGVFALGKLMLKKVQWFRSTAFSTVMIIISVISTAAISYTGYLGGQIRHTEISGSAIPTDRGGDED